MSVLVEVTTGKKKTTWQNHQQMLLDLRSNRQSVIDIAKIPLKPAAKKILAKHNINSADCRKCSAVVEEINNYLLALRELNAVEARQVQQ